MPDCAECGVSFDGMGLYCDKHELKGGPQDSNQDLTPDSGRTGSGQAEVGGGQGGGGQGGGGQGGGGGHRGGGGGGMGGGSG
jgi:hypothetical protein